MMIFLFLQVGCVTLPPIIMVEVENGSIQDDRFLYNRAIFHWTIDYGRKGSPLEGSFTHLDVPLEVRING